MFTGIKSIHHSKFSKKSYSDAFFIRKK